MAASMRITSTLSGPRVLPARATRAAARVARPARMVAVRAEAGKEDEVAASTVTSEPAATLRELTQDDYYEFINGPESADVVVVDCFTDFCGPCKMIKPMLVELNDEMDDVDIVGFNCKASNKELGQKLGIKAVPHFFIYKEGELVDEMVGADFKTLKAKIETAASS